MEEYKRLEQVGHLVKMSKTGCQDCFVKLAA